jgi:hypothetical protein
VISAATGYSPSDLEPFLKSLYANCAHAKVALIVDKQAYNFVHVLKGFNPNLFLITRPDRFLRRMLWNRWFLYCWRYSGVQKSVLALTKTFGKLTILNECLMTSLLHVKFARYFVARHLIRSNLANIDMVLLCDSRDVLFQDDPFASVTTDLVSGIEDYSIENDEINRDWLAKNYGENGMTIIGHHNVICSGVTLGRRDAILSYLDLICREISDKVAVNAFSDNGDQPLHNWVIRTQKAIQCLLVPNGHKLLATLICADLDLSFKLDERRGLLTNELEPVAILHHYDRHDVIKDWCSRNGLRS